MRVKIPQKNYNAITRLAGAAHDMKLQNGLTTLDKPVRIPKDDALTPAPMTGRDVIKAGLWRLRRHLIAVLKDVNEQLKVDNCKKCGQ